MKNKTTLVPIPGCGWAKITILNKSDVEKEDNSNMKSFVEAFQANDFEKVKELVLAEAASYRENNWEITNLIEAAKKGQIENVKRLIQTGIDVNSADKFGEIPLLAATRNGHIETVRLLIQLGADINRKGQMKDTALVYACQSGYIKIVNELIKAEADINIKCYNGADALTGAATYGHVEIVKELIKRGADVNSKEEDGRTPLIEAARLGHTEVVKVLIQEGADINVGDNRNWTPLIDAAGLGRLETVRELVKAGADMNLKNDIGWTALVSSASSGHTEIVKELIKGGASLRFKLNETILDCRNMMNRPEMKEFLENTMIEQLNQQVKIGYNDLRIEKADVEVARKLYEKPQYKDNQKLKETIALFEVASAKHIGDTLLGTQLPVYPIEEKPFRGKLKPVQKEGTKVFITVSDDTPQRHAIRDDSKISGYFAEKTDILGQNGVGNLLGKFLEIQDIGRLRQVSKITKPDLSHLTADDALKIDIEPSLLGHQDENTSGSISID